jgi:hypothetical protein
MITHERLVAELGRKRWHASIVSPRRDLDLTAERHGSGEDWDARHSP